MKITDNQIVLERSELKGMVDYLRWWAHHEPTTSEDEAIERWKEYMYNAATVHDDIVACQNYPR